LFPALEGVRCSALRTTSVFGLKSATDHKPMLEPAAVNRDLRVAARAIMNMYPTADQRVRLQLLLRSALRPMTMHAD